MRINIATIVGVLLIIVSAIALVSKGIGYTREEKVLDIGPIEATAEEREFIPIPAWASALLLATGVILVVAGVRAKP